MLFRSVATFKELLDIPEGYEVLFLGGGASLQFYMVPVSYTHLKCLGGFAYLSLTMDAYSRIITGFDLQPTLSTEAVSYTHLDVYKRQRVNWRSA